MYNQRKIQQISGWREKYPAFAWCAAQGEGWYLPAIKELKQFTLDDAVRDVVNRTLQAKCGTKIFDRKVIESYWSSTEVDYKSNKGWNFNAWHVNMYGGFTTFDIKDCGFLCYVRAVSAF